MSAAGAAIAGVEPRRMLDRYEILAEIARGGMGTVYLARLGGAGGFERLFAVKLMHEHLAEEQQFVTMLLDEARTAAHIHHPNAVGIIDARESPVGYYLVMNYVDGFSFSSILEHEQLDPTKRMRLATRLIADAAHGLHGAHAAKSPKGERLGIVHRDVSPQNILVGVDGVGRIVDFGIALAASRISSSRPGVLKGKPSYMAPEQARGDTCDARTDVFALGIVLWESLTDEPLFQADMELATLVKVMECNVPDPRTHVPGLHEALVAVTKRALQRDPADRYASAREMAVALERAAEAAGMLPDAHEVEEAIGELFAQEITQRQDAINRRLAGSTGPERPLDRAGLATVPRLIPRKAGTSSEPSIPDALPATRTDGGARSQSGVRESQPLARVDPHASTGMHESQPAVIGVPVEHRPAIRPAPRRSPALIAGLLIAFVVIAGLVGVVATMLGGDPPVAEVPVAAPAPAPAPAPEPEPEPERSLPEAAVAADPAPDPALDPALEAEAGGLPADVVVPTAPARERGGHRGGSGHAPREGAPATPATTAPPAGGGTSPQVEANPYLTH